MDKKTIIIFALGGIVVIFLLMILVSSNEISGLKQQKSKLLEDNQALKQVQEEYNVLVGKYNEGMKLLDSLKKEFDSTKTEKSGLQQRYDILQRERENLIEEIRRVKVELEKKEIAAKEAQASAAQTPDRPAQADVYWANVLKTKASLEIELSKLREELKTLKTSNEQLRQGKSGIDLDISSLTNENEDYKRELEYNKKLVDNLTQELSREKTDKYQIKENLKAVKADNKMMRQQLKTIADRKASLEAKLEEIQSRNTVLESSIAKMETFIRDKIIQMDSLKEELGLLGNPPRDIQTEPAGEKREVTSKPRESVELRPIVVHPQGAETATESTALTGNVLAINKENNFIIINLGEDAKIKPGDSFNVFNEKQDLVGNIVVVQTRKAISACDINQENVTIKVGDTVRLTTDN